MSDMKGIVDMMTPVAQKAQWTVTVRLFPGGDPITELCRGWHYTSVDYSLDGNTRGERWARCDIDAHNYAGGLAAGGHNCVEVQYVWW